MHKINYIILAHKNPSQLAKQIHSLSGEEVYFYIHLDLDSDLKEFEIQSPNVFFIKDRIRCLWGDYSLVDATLNCAKKIISDKRLGHTILLSGQDLPIQTTDFIRSFLEENSSTDFIDCRPIEEVWPNHFKYRTQAHKYNFSSEKSDFVCIPSIFSLRPRSIFRNIKKLIKRAIKDKNMNHLKILKHLFLYKKPPKNIVFYGGSQWWALTNKTLENIVRFTEENIEFTNFFNEAVIPDEVFFQTVLKKIQKNESIVKIANSLTYTKWISITENSPETLTMQHFDEIAEASKKYLFARKFDENVDERIISILVNNAMENEND